MWLFSLPQLAITSAISQSGYSICHNGNNISHLTKWLFHLPQWQQHQPSQNAAIPSATMATTSAISQSGHLSATMGITSAIISLRWLSICHNDSNICQLSNYNVIISGNTICHRRKTIVATKPPNCYTIIWQ